MEKFTFNLQLFADNSTIAKDFAEFMLKKTEKGYPALCDTGLFEPDTKGFDPPANAYLTENWTIESEDGLKLSGVHYAPKNSKGQWVVMVTGYGQVGATMNLPAMAILALDYDVLVIDPRTSGSSEGDWLTMGVAECVDVALWTQKIAETNSNAQITLFGISMGAATVIMAAALSQTINVTSLIEDCGYANIYTLFDKFATLFAEEYGWTGTNKELYDEVVAYTKSQTGYDVSEAVPADSISNVTVPSLFIHGTADTLVSVDNVQTLYDASGATEKELWTVEGAGHAKSITEEPVNYLFKAGTLIAGANEEIGASINSSASNTTILGTIYDDTISVDGDNVTIEANTGVEDSISNGGNDLISSKGNNNSIKTGDGENTVIGSGNYYTIDGGAGDDYISISGEYFSVDAGEGDNIIKIYSSFNDTIISGSGDDSISVGKGDHLNISSGDGDDTITGTAFGIDEDDWSFGGYATIDAGAGDDYIAPLYSDNSSINAGDGNDTIINNGENSTLDGGDGNDYIEMTNAATGEYESALINGGAGNDTIYTKGSNTTIDSGEGNDSIRAIEADKISINAGEGDNYVFNAFAYYDEDGNFVAKNDNPNKSTAATIIGGNGNDTLINQGINNAEVDAGEGNNFIGLYHSYYNTITTGSGKDSVVVDKGHTLKISTGAGDDSIIGRIGTIEEDSWAFGGYATIDAGAGNDYIAPIYSNNSSIYGGDGDDTIINNGKNTTIDGGAGNDYIELTDDSTGNFEGVSIIASAGNDTISGYTKSAVIIGDFTSNELDGSDVIFTNGENTVRILDAKGKIIKLIDSNGNSNSTIIGGDGSMAIEKIENGNTFESNGVLYTAVDGDAELNVEGDVVTGITSGKVEATIKDAETTPTITFDGTTAFDFSAEGSETDGLKVVIGESSVTYASGKATYDATTITYPAGEVQFKLTNALSAMLFGNIAVTVPASGVTVPNGSDGTNIFWDVLEDGVTISLTGGMVSGSVEATGGISYDADNKVISLDEGASVKGTNIGVAPDVTNFEITALNDTTVNIDGSGIGANVVFKDGASIHVSGESFGISAALATSGSDLSFPFASLLTQGGLSSISLEKNSTLTVTPDDSIAIAITTAEDDTTALASFADNKIKVSTINEKGVTLALAGNTEEILNVIGTVTVDIATAEFTFANNAVVTSTIQSLPIKYVLETAGDYKINGNEFTTNADNVEVKLLNGDTVEFVEGAALKITDDEGNSIYEITVVSGTVDYKGNAITLNDGASMSILDYEDLTSTINVSGGTYSLEVGDESATHTVGENATVTVAWNDDLTWKASNGTEVIDNYDGTLTLSKGATFETDDNKTTFILAEAGDYTINGNEITSTSDKVELKLSNNDTVEFDAKAGLTVNGQEYSGDEGTSFKVTKDGEVSMVMYKQGTATLDGQTFELTEDATDGVEISQTDDGFKVGNATLSVSGDDDYSVKLNSTGIEEIDGVSNNANVKVTSDEGTTGVKVVTETAENISFGSNAYVISDDSVNLAVDFDKNGNGTVSEISDLDGSFLGKVGEKITVNGTEITLTKGSDELSILTDNANILLSGLAEGETVTFEGDNVDVFTNNEVTVNGVTYKVEDDADGIIIGENDGITGLDKDAELTITPAGTYKVNETTLDVADGKKVVGTDDGAEILKEIGKDSTTEEILEELGIEEDKQQTISGDTYGETTLPNVSHNAAIVDESTTGEQKITLGDKGSAAIVEATDAIVSIQGGAGKDTLISKGGDVTFDASKGGKDMFTVLDGKVTISGYDPDTKSGIKLTDEQAASDIEFGRGELTINPDENSVVIGTNVDNFVNIYTPDDEEKKIGFVSNSSKVADASESTSDMLLIGGGKYENMSLAEDVEDATLKGGSGNDTIFGGKGSYIEPGAGKNYVSLSDEGGSTVNYAEGRTSIDNFNFAGGETPADTLQTGALAISAVKVSDGNVVLKTSNGRVQINDAEGKSIALKNNYTNEPINLNVGDKELDVADNGFYWAAGKDAKVSLSADYNPENGANIDITDYDFNNTDGLSFFGDIKDVDASSFDGKATITANDKANVITASGDGSTMYGGKGNDTFIGGAGADEFVIGSGKNSISGFGTDDTLNAEGAAIQSVSIDGDTVSFKTDNGSVKVADIKGQAIQFASQYTATDDSNVINLTADDTELDVQENGFYWAAGKNATVKLANYSGESAVANLADYNFNNKNGLSFYGDIKELDATGYTGNATLTGNDSNNVITGGSGSNELWGGNGGNDTLIGGDGADTFIYTYGNGKDVVQNANEGDLVKILVSIDQLKSSTFNGDDALFVMNDGGTLTVKDAATSGTKVELNSTTFSYNEENKGWQAE